MAITYTNSREEIKRALSENSFYKAGSVITLTRDPNTNTFRSTILASVDGQWSKGSPGSQDVRMTLRTSPGQLPSSLATDTVYVARRTKDGKNDASFCSGLRPSDAIARWGFETRLGGRQSQNSTHTANWTVGDCILHRRPFESSSQMMDDPKAMTRWPKAKKSSSTASEDRPTELNIIDIADLEFEAEMFEPSKASEDSAPTRT